MLPAAFSKFSLRSHEAVSDAGQSSGVGQEAPRMQSRLAILGDVHGMHCELLDLLALVKLDARTTLILAGDIIGKGPDSVEVLRTLHGLQARGINVRLVRGNHEERLSRVLAKRKGNGRPAAELRELKAIASQLTGGELAFLHSAETLLRIPNGVVVHGGIPGTMTDLNPATIARHAHALVRLRHVAGRSRLTRSEAEREAEFQTSHRGIPHHRSTKQLSAGCYVPREEREAGDPFWAEVYDGRFGTVYFGHRAFVDAAAPVKFPHAVGLDLGAVYGNRLAAAVLETDGTCDYVSVPASGGFAERPLPEDPVPNKAAA